MGVFGRSMLGGNFITILSYVDISAEDAHVM